MIDRREALALSGSAVMFTMVLPTAAAAASGDGDTAIASLEIAGTTASDGAVTVVWTDAE